MRTYVMRIGITAGLLMATAGCLGVGGREGACENIRKEANAAVRKLSRSGAGEDTSEDKSFSEMAAKIRSEGEKAGGDVRSSAAKVADDLDGIAALGGDVSPLAGYAMGSGDLKGHLDEFKRACGFK